MEIPDSARAAQTFPEAPCPAVTSGACRMLARQTATNGASMRCPQYHRRLLRPSPRRSPAPAGRFQTKLAGASAAQMTPRSAAARHTPRACHWRWRSAQ
eukprot:scaffold52998_cov51-Phaeocystis_antarctica.AAC.1